MGELIDMLNELSFPLTILALIVLLILIVADAIGVL